MYTAQLRQEALRANRPTQGLPLDDELVGQWQASQADAQAAKAELQELRADIQQQNIVVDELQQQGAADFFAERDTLKELRRAEVIQHLTWLRLARDAELAHSKVYRPFCDAAAREALAEVEKMKQSIIQQAEADYQARQVELETAARQYGEHLRNAETLKKQIADLQKQMANVD